MKTTSTSFAMTVLDTASFQLQNTLFHWLTVGQGHPKHSLLLVAHHQTVLNSTI